MTRQLLSFDIDGTLECGEPPGPITIAMVRRAKELGYIVGSCSDRPSGWQRLTWERLGIDVDFTVQKHQMERARTQFEADAYVHVGTADRDRHYTALAGFSFVPAHSAAGEPWTLDAAGQPLPPSTERLSASERARIGASE